MKGKPPARQGNCSVLEEPEEQGQSPLANPSKRGWWCSGRCCGEEFGQLWFKAATGDGDFPTEAAAACGTAQEIGGGQAKQGDVCVMLTTVCSQEQLCYLGFLKQACLTSQGLQEEIQGFLVSAEDCLNAAIPCITTLHCPLLSTELNKYAMSATFIPVFFPFEIYLFLNFPGNMDFYWCVKLLYVNHHPER